MAKRAPSEGGVSRSLYAVTEKIERTLASYANGADRPIGGYLAILGAYAAAVATGSTAVRRAQARIPHDLSVRDIALVAMGTFQLSRMLTKDPVTSVLRAPFARYEGTAGPAELREEVRGSGVRHALGELATCPFCVAHWIVTAFGFGLVVSPDVTRLVAAMLTAEATADALQFAYTAMEQRVR